MNPRTVDLSNTLEATAKTIQSIKLHRKKRHGKLREMTRDEEDGFRTRATWANGGDGETTCPVCGQSVRGDRDVVEAHVDSCLAYESQRLQEEHRHNEELEADIDVGGNVETRYRATDGANLRGEHLRTFSQNCA